MATESSPGREFARGLDVSDVQTPIDWGSIAGAGAITFAYVRATTGTEGRDAQFPANWAGLKDAGLLRGACHTLRPSKPIAAQVKHFLATVSDLAPDDLPPALSIEHNPTLTGMDEWDAVRAGSEVTLVLEWCSAVEQELGRPPILRVSRALLRRHIKGAERLAGCRLWIVDSHSVHSPALPPGWNAWTFWSPTGSSAEGLPPLVFNGSKAELRELTGGVIQEQGAETASEAKTGSEAETVPEADTVSEEEPAEETPDKRRTRKPRPKA